MLKADVDQMKLLIYSDRWMIGHDLNIRRFTISKHDQSFES